MVYLDSHSFSKDMQGLSPASADPPVEISAVGPVASVEHEQSVASSALAESFSISALVKDLEVEDLLVVVLKKYLVPGDEVVASVPVNAAKDRMDQVENEDNQIQ